MGDYEYECEWCGKTGTVDFSSGRSGEWRRYDTTGDDTWTVCGNECWVLLKPALEAAYDASFKVFSETLRFEKLKAGLGRETWPAIKAQLAAERAEVDEIFRRASVKRKLGK